MNMSRLPAWLAGRVPVCHGNARRLRWLRERRKDPAYRQAEVARQRDRRAARRRYMEEA